MAPVIPVAPRPEPPRFDEEVRQPGLRWLEERGVALDARLEPGTMIHPYWRECLDDLHRSYDGVCAYLCIFIERCTGGTSVDHFVAKSVRAGLAYEWSNYRLACATMNARKGPFDDVLDPFELAPDVFRLELVTGRMYPNPGLSPFNREAAATTIVRLGLDDPLCREMRARRFRDYVVGRGPRENLPLAGHLRRTAPFVWLEAKRQGVL